MKLTADLGKQSYDIIIKRGVLGKARRLANLGCKVLLLSDEGVPAKYIKTLLQQCPNGTAVVLPQGAAANTTTHWQAVVARMQAQDFGPHDAVVGVGGGSICSLAGFVAATYRQGIACYLFPTTTTAQLDAAVGGKSTLDLDGRKDVVGVYRQPQLVVADPDTLKTLPPRHFASGLAQALKMALTGSSQLFTLLEDEDAAENIERILYFALRYKKSVVERADTAPKQRMILDFGHVFGIATEEACTFAAQGQAPALLHGECIALGMLPMIESRTLLRRTRAVMRKLGLPLKNPCPPDEILQLVKTSPCREDDRYTVARVKTLGQGYLEQVDYEELCLLLKPEV